MSMRRPGRLQAPSSGVLEKVNGMSNSTTTSGGIGLPTILFVVFLVLKLTDHVDWSWWWVTSPLWIPLALVLTILVVGGLVMAASS